MTLAVSKLHHDKTTIQVHHLVGCVDHEAVWGFQLTWVGCHWQYLYSRWSWNSNDNWPRLPIVLVFREPTFINSNDQPTLFTPDLVFGLRCCCAECLVPIRNLFKACSTRWELYIPGVGDIVQVLIVQEGVEVVCLGFQLNWHSVVTRWQGEYDMSSCFSMMEVNFSGDSIRNSDNLLILINNYCELRFTHTLHYQVVDNSSLEIGVISFNL